MRTSTLALAVSLASIFGFSSSANAAATVDLVWVSSNNTDPVHTPYIGLGSSAIMAHPGDDLVLELRLTAGTEGLSSWGISVSFDLAELLIDPTMGDPSSPGASEFGIAPDVYCTPFPACFFEVPTLTPFTSGATDVIEGGLTTGFIFTFEAGTLGNGVAASFGQFKIGEIFFTVQTPADDGIDLSSGFFNTGADAAFDNAGNAVAMTFNSAAVDRWGPEPGTSTLLGLGLLGLILAGRRARK